MTRGVGVGHVGVGGARLHGDVDVFSERLREHGAAEGEAGCCAGGAAEAAFEAYCSVYSIVSGAPAAADAVSAVAAATWGCLGSFAHVGRGLRPELLRLNAADIAVSAL